MEELLVPAPSRSRFRFRDHHHRHVDGGDSEVYTSSSLSSDWNDDGDIELQSMAGKGIMHLCSELLELKRASDEDFHQNIFSNYSAFVSIFREVEGLKKELILLEDHVSTQKRLVTDLSDGIKMNVLPTDSVEYTFEDHNCLEPSPWSLIKAHFENNCEVFDFLLSEQRLDEALEILESESRSLETMQLQENHPLDELTCLNSAILERRAKIANQLKLVAENPRVSPAELLTALNRLHRVGDRHLATHLLFQYYHSRIVSRIHELQYVKSANDAYIHEAAKFSFSMISQARKSFSVLNGEQSNYFTDLVQWAYEETAVFAASFSKYVQSISDVNGGMVTVLEALRSALSYCSLLETERIFLKPCLVKHIRLCVEEFLENYIGHFKKVICIFTTADSWVVGRYLLSGILTKESFFMDGDAQPEYCLLTNSGWKLVTVLQAITDYVSPLVAIQLEGHILSGLMDLYREYVSLVESALTCKSNDSGNVGPGFNLAESLDQEISLLANISSLVQLLSSIMKNVFNSSSHLTFEVHNLILHIHEASDQLRRQFYQKFMSRIMDASGERLTPETWVGGRTVSDLLDDVMPSVVFQGLFFELRKLEKVAEDNFVGEEWLLEVMKELMVAIFVSILNNEEFWAVTAEELTVNHSKNLKQFVLDMQFLLEIARHGGYFCNNILSASLAVFSQMEAAFIFAGLDLKRATVDEEWAINAAKSSLEKLQAMEESSSYKSLDESDPSLRSDISQQEIICHETDFSTDNAINSAEFISKSKDMEDEIAADSMTNTLEKIEAMKSLQEQLLSDDGVNDGAWSEEDIIVKIG